MYRTIKKQTGQSTAAYIETVRLELACQKLIQTTLSIAIISEKVGFSEDTYFIRRFKKRYGWTPLQYRKKYSKQE